MNFGEFLCEKRQAKSLTLRALASMLDISFSYLSDVEKGRAKAFKPEILKKISEVLELNQTETDEMYDLAAESQDEIPADIIEHFKNNPGAVVAFRKKMRGMKDGKN